MVKYGPFCIRHCDPTEKISNLTMSPNVSTHIAPSKIISNIVLLQDSQTEMICVG